MSYFFNKTSILLLLCAISMFASDQQNKKPIISIAQMSNWKHFAVASGITAAALGIFNPITGPALAGLYGITKIANNYDYQIVPKPQNTIK